MKTKIEKKRKKKNHTYGPNIYFKNCSWWTYFEKETENCL